MAKVALSLVFKVKWVMKALERVLEARLECEILSTADETSRAL